MDDTKVSPDTQFTEDPSSLAYLFGPPFWIISFLVFFTPRVLNPTIWRAIIPREYPNLGKDKSMVDVLPCSTSHAMVASILTGYMLTEGNLVETPIYSNSPLGFFIMQFSLGYFIADLIQIALDTELRKDISMIAHHIVSIVGLFLSLYYQGKFMFFVVYRLIAESSTPFVNCFWLLRILRRQKTKLFVINSLLMMVSFFLCRIYPIWWHWTILVSTLLDPAVMVLPAIVRAWTVVTYVVFDTLNIYWFCKMIIGAHRFFFKNGKRAIG